MAIKKITAERLSRNCFSTEVNNVVTQSRCKLTSNYAAREMSWMNDRGKKTIRELVSDFILSNHAIAEPVRLLSFPSIHWSFEKMMIDKDPSRYFRFFGLESDEATFNQCHLHTPGGKPFFYRLYLTIGHIDRFINAGGNHSTDVLSDDRKIFSHILLCRASSFFSLRMSELQSRGKNNWYVYGRMTGMWLDFNCMLSTEIHSCLKNAGSFCYPCKKEVPIAVTFLAARDNHHCDDDRVDEVCAAFNRNICRSFQLTSTHKYVHSGSPMLTVFGLLVNKSL